MSPEREIMTDLNELQAHCAAVSPGPWKYDPDNWDILSSENVIICCLPEPRQADAEFIALARNELPALLVRMRALEKVREAAEVSRWPNDDEPYEELREALAALKAAEGGAK